MQGNFSKCILEKITPYMVGNFLVLKFNVQYFFQKNNIKKKVNAANLLIFKQNMKNKNFSYDYLKNVFL